MARARRGHHDRQGDGEGQGVQAVAERDSGMGNKFTPEEAYSRLGHLITEMPDLDARPISSDTVQWLARVVATIEATGDPQAHTITYETQRLGATFSPDAARRIELHLKTALQRVELQLPVDARGSFIPAGNPFDAFAA